MKPLRIQNCLQFHSVIAVSKTVKNQKHQRKTDISGNHRMISSSCDFFYSSPNLGCQFVQILRKRKFVATRIEILKLFLSLAFLKYDESIKSGTCFPSIFPQIFGLGRKHYQFHYLQKDLYLN